MANLETFLRRLGMAEYTGRFLDEGFDTWEAIMDITATDLDALAISLPHQERLQQEISNARAPVLHPFSASLDNAAARKYISLHPSISQPRLKA
jgi:hypothetical protein